MPWDIEKVGEHKFKVTNAETGEVHAKGTSKKNAKAQVRLLAAIKHNPDFRPRNA